MAISRTPIIDDDGSGSTGTVIDNAWKQEFYDQIDGVIAPIDIVKTGTSVTFNAAGGAISTNPGQIRYLYVQGAGTITITSVTPGNAGDILIIQNLGAGTIVALTYGEGAGQFLNNVSSGPTRLVFGGSAIYVSPLGAGQPWYLMQHEQGGPITAPFAAGNFTAGAGTWTVTSGQVQGSAYYLRGRQLQITLDITGSSISATTSNLNYLNAGWGGYIFSTNIDTLGWSGTGTSTRVLTGPVWSPSSVQLYRADGSQWPAAVTSVALNVTAFVT